MTADEYEGDIEFLEHENKDMKNEIQSLKQAVRDIKLILDKAYSCESHTQIILYIGQCLLNIERIMQEGEKDAVD